MNLDKINLHNAVGSGREILSIAIERVLSAAVTERRKASVTVTYSAQFDKDRPGVLVLSSVLKIKEPKGPGIDLSAKSEAEELMRISVGEEVGQTRMEG